MPAQAAYIVRPNERTLTNITELRRATLRNVPASLAAAVSVRGFFVIKNDSKYAYPSQLLLCPEVGSFCRIVA